jgi:hypothetical protein
MRHVRSAAVPRQPGNLMREQRPGEGVGQHALGRSPENEFPQLGMAIGAHHQQVDAALNRKRFKNIANSSALCLDLIERHLHAMSGQVLAQLCPRAWLMQMLLVDDSDDMNMLCRPQHGQRIGDGSRRGAAVIPGHGGPVKRRRQLSGRGFGQ